jgi:hypothetical protein
LPLPKESAGMAPTPEEEAHWFKVAGTRKRWQICYYCSLVQRGTTAGPCELINLKLRDVQLEWPDGPDHPGGARGQK